MRISDKPARFVSLFVPKLWKPTLKCTTSGRIFAMYLIMLKTERALFGFHTRSTLTLGLVGNSFFLF